MVLRLPVTTVKEGEIVVLSESPFTAAFIDEVETGGKVRVAKTDGSVTDFEPPANLLVTFYVKATNLMESFGSGGGDKNLLPLMLLLGKGESGAQSDSLLPFLLMQLGEGGGGGGGALSNPLLLALLLRGDKGDWLQTSC